MTQVPAGLGAEQRDSPGPASGDRQPGGGYLELLRTPGAAQFSLAGMVGRAPMAMFGLGTILLIAASTGRYGLAGTIAAAGSVSYALCARPDLGPVDHGRAGRCVHAVAGFYGPGPVERPAG